MVDRRRSSADQVRAILLAFHSGAIRLLNQNQTKKACARRRITSDTSLLRNGMWAGGQKRKKKSTASNRRVSIASRMVARTLAARMDRAAS